MSPDRGSRTPPGVVSTKSMKLRPLTGKLAMALSLTTELTSDFVVSTRGAAAVTVTVSVTPGRILRFSVTSVPTLTTTLSYFTCWKPASSETTEYVAGGSSGIDRKSTRLNSSHTVISYAVFCLKKKKKKEEKGLSTPEDS